MLTLHNKLQVKQKKVRNAPLEITNGTRRGKKMYKTQLHKYFFSCFKDFSYCGTFFFASIVRCTWWRHLWAFKIQLIQACSYKTPTTKKKKKTSWELNREPYWSREKPWIFLPSLRSLNLLCISVQPSAIHRLFCIWTLCSQKSQLYNTILLNHLIC